MGKAWGLDTGSLCRVGAVFQKLFAKNFLWLWLLFPPRAKEMPRRQSLGNAMSLSSTNCRIEVSRNDCATACCFRTYFTVRQSYSTSRVLQMRPALICLATRTQRIAVCGLQRILMWFTKNHCIRRKLQSGKPCPIKDHWSYFLWKNLWTSLQICMFSSKLRNSLTFSPSKMVQHPARQENPRHSSRISWMIEW